MRAVVLFGQFASIFRFVPRSGSLVFAMACTGVFLAPTAAHHAYPMHTGLYAGADEAQAECETHRVTELTSHSNIAPSVSTAWDACQRISVTSFPTPPVFPYFGLCANDAFDAWMYRYWSGSGANVTAVNRYHYFCTQGEITCPPGQAWNGTSCEMLVNPDKSLGCPETPVGNPCHAGTGNKFQVEVDIPERDGMPGVARYYNSGFLGDTGFGRGWLSTHHARIEIGVDKVLVRRSTGMGAEFSGAGLAVRDADIPFSLTTDIGGYTVATPDGDSERYDTTGFLLATTDRAGRVTNYSYSNGRLHAVTGPNGHRLTFEYDDGDHLTAITDATGAKTRYQYVFVHGAARMEGVSYPDGTGRQYHYEDIGFPHKMTGISHTGADGTQRYSRYTYDDQGRATLTEHAGGTERFTLAYDSGSQTTVTDAAGTRQTLQFGVILGVKKLLSAHTPADNKTLAQLFDARNNLLCRKDREGRVTTYSYSATNQLLSMTEGRTGTCAAPVATSATRTTTYGYLAPDLDLPTVIASPSVASGRSHSITLAYGTGAQARLPVSITAAGFTPSGAPVARTVTLGYNSAGQVTTIDGPRTDVNDITTLTYYTCTTGGACGQLQSVTNALGHTTTFDAYDAGARLLTMTDPNGLKTHYAYDARGRTTRVTQTPPVGEARVTEYVYTSAGDVAEVTLPDGQRLTYNYNAARQLTRVTDHLGHYVAYAYDSRGNRTQHALHDASGALLRHLTLAHDLRNRPASVNADGSVTTLVFDAIGNLTAATDPKGNTSQRQYDALNRLTQTINALNGTTTVSYDASGAPSAVTAPNNAATAYQYDDLGNLTQEISPDRGTTRYTHDAAGNVKTRTDARGVVVTYSYDALNRVTTIDYPGTAEDVTFGYDESRIGALTFVRDASTIARTFLYDPFGNLVTEARVGNGGTFYTGYAHDALGRITGLSWTPIGHGGSVLPGAGSTTYTRDALGRIESIRTTLNGVDTPVLSNRTYRADGLLASQTFGNGLIDTRDYDPQGRLVHQRVGSGATRLYDYDANGNVTRVETPFETRLYQYDALDRLTQGKLGSSTDTLTYDANGNRRKLNSKTYTVASASNRLTKVEDEGAIAYDASGNILSYEGGTYKLTHTNAGQLQTVSRGSTLKGSYTYDYRHLRTRKLAGGITTSYFYDHHGRLLAETDEAGATEVRYIWSDDEPIAQITRTNGTDTLIYLHTDHLGSVRLATDPQPKAVWRWNSSAFGNGDAQDDPDGDKKKTTVNLRFPGQYYDNESGLHYNWHRYYHPRWGRYVTSDLIGLRGGLNTYLYGNANPLGFIDPDGLSPTGDALAGFADNWFSALMDSYAKTNPIMFYFAPDVRGHDLRESAGYGDSVDYCSPFYDGGQWVYLGASILTGGYAGLRAAGSKATGLEFSHAIPARWNGPRSLWNGNYVPTIQHALSDPYRYQFMARAWKAENPISNWFSRMWNRIPNTWLGTGAGTISGSTTISENGCQCRN